MSEFELFGEDIYFSDAADRFWAVQHELWYRFDAVGRAFDQWYSSRSVLRNPLDEVLIGSERKVEQMMEQNFVTPFYLMLTQFELNYFSTTDFRKQCLQLDIFRETIRVLGDYTRNISIGYDPAETEEALRAASSIPEQPNEDPPPVVLAGPDAPDNLYPDAAEVMPIRTAPMSEHTRQKHLFELAATYLHRALKNCFMVCVDRFVRMVSDEFPSCFSNDFSYERSVELLSRGEPGEGDLVKAFTACPWNREFYNIAFSDYPDEQLALFRIASKFHIDLTDAVLETLDEMYENRKSNDEAELRKLRVKLQDRGRRFGLKDLEVVDTLENNILGQICEGYEEADRLTCCQMELIVHKQELQEKNKKIWMKRLQARLDELSSTDDGVNFQDYLLNCSVLTPSAVAEGARFVEEECPEESKALFLDAFRTFSVENIRSARAYQPISGSDFTSRFIKSWGYILMVIGVILLTALRGWWIYLGGAIIAGGMILQVYFSQIRKLWNRMTLQGTIIHKVFTVDNERFKKMCEAAASAGDAGGTNMSRKGKYD